MKYNIQYNGNIESLKIDLPTSKSISNRALILNALSYSPFEIKNLSTSDDTVVLNKALNSSQGTAFDIGAAGTSMRFLTAFLSKILGEWTITGSERMKQRPIKILVDAINSLGGKIEYIEKEGYPPLKIYGSALEGGSINLDGSVSSQYISALLMIAPSMKNGLSIKFQGDIISRPYMNLTLQMMLKFGVKHSWKDKNTIDIAPQEYTPCKYSIEGDWSAASYWLQIVALAEGSNICLNGLLKKSPQGDSKVVDIFKGLGVECKHTRKGLELQNVKPTLKHFKYNFINQPDLAQTLAVTCCCLGITFDFGGLETLKIKETDRISALIKELSKLGFVLTTNNIDSLSWDGTTCKPENNCVIETYKDHRMAMAFAPAACTFDQITIDDPMVVTKSYPNFWEHLSEAGLTHKSID